MRYCAKTVLRFLRYLVTNVCAPPSDFECFKCVQRRPLLRVLVSNRYVYFLSSWDIHLYVQNYLGSPWYNLMYYSIMGFGQSSAPGKSFKNQKLIKSIQEFSVSLRQYFCSNILHCFCIILALSRTYGCPLRCLPYPSGSPCRTSGNRVAPGWQTHR